MREPGVAAARTAWTQMSGIDSWIPVSAMTFAPDSRLVSSRPGAFAAVEVWPALSVDEPGKVSTIKIDSFV
ncbi:hypothetical protein ABT294_36870 [Nonomuraea sp. NPDC000554]|uniref:hypothetical protein n=1 Tax=Nonomuraea sp. NPDC000554 TaxID=3154259 RepID=UPI003317C8EE